MKKPRWRRALGRAGLALAGALVSFLLVVVIDGWHAFGRSSEGERRDRIAASPQWEDDHFENPQPLWNDTWRMITGLAGASAHTSPDAPVPFVPGDRTRFDQAPASGVRVTWLGHSTIVIEIDGHRVLTDPVFSERSSPVGWIGPRRWYPPPIALEQLAPIDAVVISHDHYDHLDFPTIRAMKDWDTTFVVPPRCGPATRWSVPATAPTSPATPGSSLRSTTSGRGSGRST